MTELEYRSHPAISTVPNDEGRGLIECESCCVCKHFEHFHGAAGICKVGNGCLLHDMRDVFDTCDNGNFEPKPIMEDAE